ncbi:MAG: cytochrome c, partial [Chloroflexi bacterium]|nr:cytochrome c [Chloroflexota bacterium]
IDAGMPPFGPSSSNPINDENRWDLVAAVYSLGTSEEAVGMGQAVYAENCAECHGEDGAGDGAAASATDGLDLTKLNYWFNRSAETVLADIPGDIAEHEFELSDAEKEAVVHYARTFSYAYAAPIDPNQPIEGAAVTGEVSNGATGTIITDGIVRLRAYTMDFQETLNLTTTVGIDGRF